MLRERLTIRRFMFIVGLLALDLALFRVANHWFLLAAEPTVTVGLISWLLTDGRFRRFSLGFTLGGLIASSGILVLGLMSQDFHFHDIYINGEKVHLMDMEFTPSDVDLNESNLRAGDQPFVAVETSAGPIATCLFLLGLSFPAATVALIGGLVALAACSKERNSPHPIKAIS